MPRNYFFGMRRYFGGRFVRFESEGHEDSHVGTWGQLAAPTIVRGIRLPAGAWLSYIGDYDEFQASADAALMVHGHRVPEGTRLDFSTNPFLKSWLFGLLSIGKASQEGVGGALLLLLGTILGFVLAPVLIPFCSWYYTRWTKVTVSEPTQIGALLAMPERPVEISWSGEVRFFEDPVFSASTPAASHNGEEQP